VININLDSLSEDPAFLADLGNGVWLMDDHRWALKVWETERKHDHYTLVHADYHWDGCYDFHDQPDAERMLVDASPDQVAKLVAEGEWIKYDSFIAPAVRRGLVHTVHFYCLQDGMGDDALDEDFLHTCGARQVLHATPGQLSKANIVGPSIFDLCLDLFNRSDEWAEGDLWTDAEIDSFLNEVGSLVSEAELVTVSLSFNYSGTSEQTRHLAKVVLPQILGRRGDA
jgi:hypothetical protein